MFFSESITCILALAKKVGTSHVDIAGLKEVLRLTRCVICVAGGKRAECAAVGRGIANIASATEAKRRRWSVTVCVIIAGS